MKPSTLALLIALTAPACAKHAPVRNPPPIVQSDAAEVGRVLDAFHGAAARADEAGYFALFARDGVFLGTDATERWTVEAFRDYAHPHFEKGEGWTYVAKSRHVSFGAGGDVAWFDELLDNERHGELRGTGVLVREGRAWKIAQYNLTFTVPNDIARDVVRMLKTKPAPAP